MLKKSSNEMKNTAHSKYRCQYYIVFVPKYRRKEIYGQLKKDIEKQKGVEIIEAEACIDHIHMLVKPFVLTSRLSSPDTFAMITYPVLPAVLFVTCVSTVFPLTFTKSIV